MKDKKERKDRLIDDYIYIQTFCIHQRDEPLFRERCEDYINYMLNEFGLYFYKATLHESEKIEDVFPEAAVQDPYQNLKVFSLHFYMFTYDRLVETPGKRESCESMEHLQNHFKNVSIDHEKGFSTQIFFERKTYHRRPEFHSIDLPENSYFGKVEGLNWGVFKTFIYWWLIVPRVQTDFFDIMYQMYSFDLAHQGWFPKYAHYFTIPGNVAFTLAFLCQYKFTLDWSQQQLDISLALIVVLILSAFYIINGARYNMPTWGFSTALVIGILFIVAQMFYETYKIEGNPWYNSTIPSANPLLWMYISSSIESLSHIVVPQLPPYVTGWNSWQSTKDFFLKGRAIFLFFSAVNAILFAPLVSYMSWPHLIGNMILYQLFGLGYHKEFYESYQRMVQKACLSGNPAIDRIPSNFQELLHGAPGNSGEKSSISHLQLVYQFFVNKFNNGNERMAETRSNGISNHDDSKPNDNESLSKKSVKHTQEEKKNL